MKITKRKLRQLILEIIGAPKECVTDNDPAVIAFKSQMSRMGIPMIDVSDDEIGMFFDFEEVQNILGDPLTILEIENMSMLPSLQSQVAKIEDQYPNVRFAWVSYTTIPETGSLVAKEAKVDFLGVYATYAGNMTIPVQAETFEKLTDLATAKSYGFGC